MESRQASMLSISLRAGMMTVVNPMSVCGSATVRHLLAGDPGAGGESALGVLQVLPAPLTSTSCGLGQRPHEIARADNRGQPARRQRSPVVPQIAGGRRSAEPHHLQRRCTRATTGVAHRDVGSELLVQGGQAYGPPEGDVLA